MFRTLTLTAGATHLIAIAGPWGKRATAVTEAQALYSVVPQTPAALLSLPSGTYAAGQTLTITLA